MTTEHWTKFQEATPMREGFPASLGDNQRMYANSIYTVIITLRGEVQPDWGMCFELSIRRTDRKAIHDWRHFQQIKNELIGEEYFALEVYPAESTLVDSANQYYLYAFEHADVRFGFKERFVAAPDAEFVKGSVQRPFDKPPPDIVGGKWQDQSRLTLVRGAIDALGRGATAAALAMLRAVVAEDKT